MNTSGTTAQTKTLYIDPASAIGTSVSELFAKVRYIPLETTRQSTISWLADMVVTDELIIVLDPPASAVLFFDKNGKFLSKYTDKSNKIVSLKLNKFTNSIFIQTERKGYSLTVKEQYQAAIGEQPPVSDFYNLFECKLNTKDTFRFEAVPGFKYGGYNLIAVATDAFLASLIYADETFNDKSDYELKLIKNNKIEQEYFSYNLKHESPYFLRRSKISFINAADRRKVFFTRPYHYEMYSYEANRIAVAYQFVFPSARSLPPGYLDSDLSTQTNRDLVEKKYQGAVKEIVPLWYQGDRMVFWLSTLQPNNMMDKKLYMLELNSGTLVYLRRVSPDRLSYNLPVNLDWCLYGNQSGLFSFISSYDLLNAAKNISIDKADRPPELNEFLERKNAKANPVIIQVTNK